MLGKHTDVHLYGTISSNQVYSGYIEYRQGGVSKQESVFILSNEPISDSVNGIVIATAACADNNIKLIVAPIGEVFYEPEIREKLALIHNFKYGKLLCLYEKSCGAVVFYRNMKHINVLLVKNRNGKYWSFPKGHVEQGENEYETATREIKEETGLDVIIYEHYRQISDYIPFGKIKKRVVFFLAEATSDNVKIQQDEIDSFTWVPFSQAQQMCRYENDLRLLSTAQQAIYEHDKQCKTGT
ncbi:MAG TPA: NUDIX domain-containing protein [Clostridiales bacterium]|nr:NUDIX domain-containing protein [Clostridiales bacterium]